MLESYKDIADSLHLLSDWTVDDLCKESMYVRDICEEGSGIIKEMMEKLTAYEDAEEQGLLVRLPCKVGDMVYYKRGCDILGDTVERIVIDGIDNQIILNAHRTFLFCDLGRNVFLTFEEAEAALKGGTGDV